MTRNLRAVLALVLIAYLLPLALPVPLMEDDEGLHAAMALEMVERGDWVVPRLLGEPFLDKPILYFWLEAGSIAAFGPSEFAVRLPGPLLGLAAAAATGWLATTLFGSGLGWWAALVYATMLLPYAVTLAPLHDLVMVPLVAIALGAFWRVHLAATTGAAVRWTLVAGVALGLSMLGKGLTGAGLIGVGMVAWMAWTRTWSVRLVASGAAAVALGAAIAAPWYLAMEAASPGYLRYFILERHVGGVAGEAQRHAGRPFWYYLPILVAGTWPWAVAVVRRGWRASSSAERLVWSWLVADLLLLSVAGSKLATYLLPAFPAVALLAARALGEGDAAARRATPAWTFWITALLPASGLAYYVADAGLLPSPAGMAAAVVTVAVVAWAARPGEATARSERLAVVTVTALLAVAIGVRPLTAVQLTAKSLARDVNARGIVPRQLVIVDEGIGSFLFYLEPDLRRGLTPERVRRTSRFSLADFFGAPDVLVAIAGDRLAGVKEMYDIPAGDSIAPGDFHLIPLEQIRPRR